MEGSLGSYSDSLNPSRNPQSDGLGWCLGRISDPPGEPASRTPAPRCRGLEAMLNQRRKLLQYLRRSKFDAYAVLISRLGLKDSYGPADRLSQRYK